MALLCRVDELPREGEPFCPPPPHPKRSEFLRVGFFRDALSAVTRATTMVKFLKARSCFRIA